MCMRAARERKKCYTMYVSRADGPRGNNDGGLGRERQVTARYTMCIGFSEF